MNPFDSALIAEIERGRNLSVENFTLAYVLIKHQDGSVFKIANVMIERRQVNEIDCIFVYPEHNSICLFVEADLESVQVKPRKGKNYKLLIKTE